MSKAQEELQSIHSLMEDSSLYDSERSEELTELLKREATLKTEIETLEEDWLMLETEIETIREEMEAAL